MLRMGANVWDSPCSNILLHVEPKVLWTNRPCTKLTRETQIDFEKGLLLRGPTEAGEGEGSDSCKDILKIIVCTSLHFI